MCTLGQPPRWDGPKVDKRPKVDGYKADFLDFAVTAPSDKPLTCLIVLIYASLFCYCTRR